MNKNYDFKFLDCYYHNNEWKVANVFKEEKIYLKKKEKNDNQICN